MALTPINREEEWLAEIRNSMGVTAEALTVTENGTYTAETGTAYSPVTVNVAGSGGRTEYVKSFATISAMRIPDDERTILLNTPATFSFTNTGGNTITVGCYMKDDGAYGVIEVCWWLLFVIYFGYISVGADSCTQYIRMHTIGQTTDSSVDISAFENAVLTFYVTPEQKAQLEAL